MHTGRPVGEHGLYEWNLLEPSLDAIVTPLLFSFAGDHGRDTLEGALDPAALIERHALPAARGRGRALDGHASGVVLAVDLRRRLHRGRPAGAVRAAPGGRGGVLRRARRARLRLPLLGPDRRGGPRPRARLAGVRRRGPQDARRARARPARGPGGAAARHRRPRAGRRGPGARRAPRRLGAARGPAHPPAGRLGARRVPAHASPRRGDRRPRRALRRPRRGAARDRPRRARARGWPTSACCPARASWPGCAPRRRTPRASAATTAAATRTRPTPGSARSTRRRSARAAAAASSRPAPT